MADDDRFRVEVRLLLHHVGDHLVRVVSASARLHVLVFLLVSTHAEPVHHVCRLLSFDHEGFALVVFRRHN